MAKILKLGTRRSLLAWAQSSWVAREVERLNPGVSVELIGIDTRGDKILDIPLQAVAGKEFFVAEIDDALRAKRVDFTVHSMKDLSLDRPEDFVCGAVPRRENPRDVILFGPRVMERLRAGKRLRIGTSSPRRLENLPAFLAQALPTVSSARGPLAPATDWLEIRGNVNTRLSRVHQSEDSEKYLDGVVLAFAGLIRLWADQAGRTELERLLSGVRWMVLPLAQCPAAPAQGALAVECRREDAETRQILGALDDPSTATRVARERQLLADWGGGCHQKFGATVVEHAELGDLFWIRGRKPDGEFVEELRWDRPEPLNRTITEAEIWDGSRWRGSRENESIPLRSDDKAARSIQAVFVAHSRAMNGYFQSILSHQTDPVARIWTSGVASWFRMAKQGFWVEGCAEGLGFDFLSPVLSEPVLRLPKFRDWAVLTHERGRDGWSRAADGGQEPQVFSTYKVETEYDAGASNALRGAKYLFWSSGSQFDALKEFVPSGAVHATGAGKTVAHLRTQGVLAQVFPSAEEWRKWLKV